jgi:hypothetical protein
VKHLTHLIVIIYLFLTACQGVTVSNNDSSTTSSSTGIDTRHLILTKHARCRMDCRHIDESEIKEILQQGHINSRKSDPAARPDPKYAYEGTTHDGQQVRIIAAPTNRGTVIITVIDLKIEWSCNCH